MALAQTAAELYGLDAFPDALPTIQEVSQDAGVASRAEAFVQKFANTHLQNAPAPLGQTARSRTALKFACVVLGIVLDKYDQDDTCCGLYQEVS